ncbi:MAG: hypothetical protein GY720_19830 [bacterium]|nr:hypothetical protein [bacterium]
MIESGSFRDPSARVFYHEGRVLRGLAPDAADVDAATRASGLMGQLVSKGLFVDNWIVDDVEPPEGVPRAAVVESARLPVVSYPSEWSFAMLKDAALVTLDANLAALEEGFILKDASAFNLIFDATTPVIIDVSSIDPFGEKGIWTAYSQFCDHFLAPLMLESYAGVPFQRFLHGKVDGLPIGDLNRMLRGRSGIHKGVLSHVRLRSALERRASRMDTQERSDVGGAQLPTEAIVGSMQKIRKLISGLESTAGSTWADYEEALPYAPAEVEAKARFVEEVAAAAASHDVALDVGANAGRFTKILSNHFDHVIGIDKDAGAIDGLYRAAGDAGLDNLTPLVVDITNPTPSFGWRGSERASFVDRVKPSFATWLAVVHHLCLGIGIPIDQVVALIAESSDEAVVEFVSIEDPMSRRISASRQDALAPYSQEVFEEAVAGTVVSRSQVTETRALYHLRSL